MSLAGSTNRGTKRPASLALIGALLAATSCAEPETSANREKWETVRPARYSFSYSTTGFAPHLTERSEVRDGQVVSSSCEGTLVEPCPGRTIDGVFDLLEQRLAGEASAEVEYDPTWHFPAKASFEIGEEGDGFVIRDFVRLD